MQCLKILPGFLYGLPRWRHGKDSTCQGRRCKRCRFSPWIRKIPWSRKWQPTQYSCLENSMDRGTWLATVHGVSKSRTPQTYTQTHRHTDTQTHTQTFPVMSNPLILTPIWSKMSRSLLSYSAGCFHPSPQ